MRHTGLVAARRSDRLHEDRWRLVLYRRHAAGWLRRAAPDRRFSRRRTDLGAERARLDVFPRRPLRGRASRRIAALYDRPDRRQSARSQYAGRCLRPGLVALAPLAGVPGHFISNRHHPFDEGDSSMLARFVAVAGALALLAACSHAPPPPPPGGPGGPGGISSSRFGPGSQQDLAATAGDRGCFDYDPSDIQAAR